MRAAHAAMQPCEAHALLTCELVACVQDQSVHASGGGRRLGVRQRGGQAGQAAKAGGGPALQVAGGAKVHIRWVVASMDVVDVQHLLRQAACGGLLRFAGRPTAHSRTQRWRREQRRVGHTCKSGAPCAAAPATSATATSRSAGAAARGLIAFKPRGSLRVAAWGGGLNKLHTFRTILKRLARQGDAALQAHASPPRRAPAAAAALRHAPSLSTSGCAFQNR